VTKRGGLFITEHAIQRYRERVEDVTEDQARERLSGPVFDLAGAMGACAVVLTTGHRAICEGGAIVTVLSRQVKVRRKRPIGDE
jgi:hypothetical protein